MAIKLIDPLNNGTHNGIIASSSSSFDLLLTNRYGLKKSCLGWNDNGHSIIYANGLFGASGTISFYIYVSAVNDGGTIIGSDYSTRQAGDLMLAMYTARKLVLSMRDAGGTEHFLTGTTALALQTWCRVTISYGTSGLKLYVNGVREGAFDANGDTTQAMGSKNVAFGRMPNTANAAIWGYLDTIQSSDVQSDPLLIGGPTSSLVFGSYVFPAAFVVNTLDGDTRIDTSDIPAGDGFAVGTPRRKGRNIRISGMLSASTPFDLRQALDTMATYLSSGRQKLYITADRYIYATKTSFATNYDPGSQSRYCDVAVDFLCDDPFWAAQDAMADTWASPTNGVAHLIPTGGNTYLYPVFEITASSTGNIAITLTNATGEAFTLNGAVTSGDVLVVDCGAQTVKLKATGADKMSLFDGVFWALPGTGHDLITLTRTTGATISQILTTWRNRWM